MASISCYVNTLPVTTVADQIGTKRNTQAGKRYDVLNRTSAVRVVEHTSLPSVGR